MAAFGGAAENFSSEKRLGPRPADRYGSNSHCFGRLGEELSASVMFSGSKRLEEAIGIPMQLACVQDGVRQKG